MQYDVTPFQWDYVIDRMIHKCINSNGPGILGSGGTSAKFEVRGVAFTHLMQYTGLKDKKGKEIYDGDVLRYGTSPVYQVKMNYSAWSAICKTENGTASVLLHNREKLFEVIGNIYENGNLLDNGK